MIKIDTPFLEAFGDEISKIAAAVPNPGKLSKLRKFLPWVGGAGAFYAIEKAEKDRRLGRQVRVQSRR